MNYKQILAKNILHISNKEAKNLDNHIEKKLKIKTIQLMEIAGYEIAEFISNKKNIKHILCICGKGNNGGDGLVAARHLHSRGYLVDIVLATNKKSLTQITKKQLQSCLELKMNYCYKIPTNKSYDLTIDAILGVGQKEIISTPLKELITQINNLQTNIVSIDTPTGISSSIKIIPNDTLTFILPKKSFLENHEECGNIYLCNLGIKISTILEHNKNKIISNKSIIEIKYESKKSTLNNISRQ